MNIFEREISLIGNDAFAKLKGANILILGLGGVGCYAAEALLRAGIGKISVCDGDKFCESNLNRQLYALRSTIGRNKAEVFAERAADINEDAEIKVFPEYYGEDTADRFSLSDYTYIADCIDDTSAKILLAKNAQKCDVPLISCMGTALRLDSDFRIADIYKTSSCPLCKSMRKLCRDNGIESLCVLYSPSLPLKKQGDEIGSLSYPPAAAGLKIAEHIIRNIILK